MSQATSLTEGTIGPRRRRSLRSVVDQAKALVVTLEIDTRLLGMVAALGFIWLLFGWRSNWVYLEPRNLWNLSVQSSAIAIVATGMVLIIVSRNIDLSVGSVIGFLGYLMAMIQVVWIPVNLHLGLGGWYIWIAALVVGLIAGALVGGLQGVIVAYGNVPAFIVTLGGYLVWRGLIFWFQQGQTISPLDDTFDLIGGQPQLSIGLWPSWILGFLACIGIIWMLTAKRRERRKYGFPVRPMWAQVTLIVAGCAAVLAAVWVSVHYYWPEAFARQYAKDHNIAWPDNGLGLQIPVGISVPVLILAGVAIVMTYIATRRPFGRYVFAIGGNPEAAELAGINVRRTIVGTFVLMGILAGISGAVLTARLDSAVTGLGFQAELDAIAAAVIGGTSFAGGVGTIPGAILGAVVMQSLRSGMLLFGWDSPTQDIVVGVVLVAAVGFDTFLHRKSA